MAVQETGGMSDGLSKSRFCEGVRCPKMLWMEKYAEDRGREIDNSLIFENGHRVGALAQPWYGDFVEVEFDRDNKPKMIAETEELLREGHVNICEASFGYDGLFCRVDVLHRNDDGSFDMIEVKSSTRNKEIYLWDIAFQYYVLKRAGIDVRRAYLMYINKEYERRGELDTAGFFTLEDCTERAASLRGEVEKRIDGLRDILLSEEEPDIAPGRQCFDPYECAFRDYCNGTEGADAADPNDIRYAGDADTEAARSFAESLSHPLAFLRIEICMYPIPPFDGLTPYRQIPFMYTLLIEREDGGTEIREFMPEIEEGAQPDPRRALAESLCEDIPEDACVITCARGSEAYDRNVEARAIGKLAWTFPDLRRRLLSIKDRCVDLADAFDGAGSYYAPGPAGEGKEVESAFIYMHEKPADKRDEIKDMWTAYGRRNVETLHAVAEMLPRL